MAASIRLSTMAHRRARVCFVLLNSLAAGSVFADDVSVQPASGSGFVVKDASGASERLRVQESGAISLPGIATAPAQAQALCVGAAGLLGPCAGGGGGVGTGYSAGAGLVLGANAFSIAPTYRLPQGCTASQVAQWSGSTWTCATPPSANLSGSGVRNQLARWTPDGATLGASVISDNGLTVGIDAAPTSNVLQVGPNTASFIGNDIAIGNSNGEMAFSQTSGAAVWYSSSDFALLPSGGTGFVGIGVAAPINRLQIGNVGGYSGNDIAFGNGSNASGIVQTNQIAQWYSTTPIVLYPSNGSGTHGLGIDTSAAPVNRLQIGTVGGYSGNDIAFGNGAQASGFAQTAGVAQWYSTTNIVLMPGGAGHGRVGINTTSPAAPLEVDDYAQNGGLDGGSYAYFEIYGFQNDQSKVDNCHPSCLGDVSIYASNNVMALEFDADSDARIKNVAGLSDGAHDLDTLTRIEVTDYTLKDSVRERGRPFKKVIAQQVESVYPQVVSRHTDFVPTVYRTADAVENVSAGTRLHFDAAHGIGAQAKRVRLLVEGEDAWRKLDLAGVPNANDLVVNANDLAGKKVFVYGEEVDDFRTVDYEGLTTLNISATQELVRRIEAQQAQIAALEAALARLESRSVADH